MVVMTLQRPVKVMDWDPGEANCLCGKFIGGCRCLRSTRPPGGWNAWNARRARPLQLNAPVPGPCRLLGSIRGRPSRAHGGETELFEKGKEALPAPPPRQRPPPPSRHAGADTPRAGAPGLIFTQPRLWSSPKTPAV